MTIRYAFCLYTLFSINFFLPAQDLDGNVFIIQSKGTNAEGRVIEADYNDLGKTGSKVQLWDMKASSHQTWKFEVTGDGVNRYYYIVNQSPKAGKYKYLEAAWTTLGQDGGRVQLWEFNGASNLKYGANQIWQVTKNNDGSYSIISAHPKSEGKVLEAESFTQQNNGGKVHLYFNVNTPNQTWNLLEQN